MSKRNQSIGSTNTLFNYFNKTPSSNKKLKPDKNINDGCPAPESPKNDSVAVETRKRERVPARKSYSDESNDEAPIVKKQRKRIRINPLDSDSDIENKDDIIQKSSSSRMSVANLRDSFQYDPNQSSNRQLSPEKSTDKNSILTSSSSGPTIVLRTSPEPREEELDAGDADWVHTKLEWLKPEKIKDKQRRRPDHPDYDPSTLYIPPDFLNSQTPAHRQWWEMKSTRYDCVLFFKVGKFYELYHMDASVGVIELGFNYMKGDFAHSGFPEVAYGRMASTLISKGYKVARVEQTETPEMMQDRCKKSGRSSKFDKVFRREVCAVSMLGTQVYDLQDSGPCEPSAIYMMAITEEEHKDDSSYGVCFVDTSIGHFHLGQFDDDKHSSRLLTTLAHYPPAYIAYDRRTVTPRTSKLLSSYCHSARREPLAMWTPEQTLKTLAQKYYMTSPKGDWPEGLKPFLHDGDALGLTPAAGCSLAVRALGGCVATLTNCLLDIQVLGMSQFYKYAPPDVLNEKLSLDEAVEATWTGGRTMVLDSITLANLRIINDEGCLYDRLNSCVTPMGKRLLYQWVCAPSCNLTTINERQAAVRVLLEDHELSRSGKAVLATLPDFERVLAKLHALGNTTRSKQHPDARAIFYEEKIYSKKNVSDFMSMLTGFAAALKLGSLFAFNGSALLKRLTQHPPCGKFPDYTETLEFFNDGINQKEAKEEGRILPREGVDEVYDAALREIKEINADADEYLNLQERHFRCKLRYVGIGKRRFQLEIPKKGSDKVGPGFNLEGKSAKGMRYCTEATRGFLARMVAAEERKASSLKDVNRRVFQKFTAHYDQWEAAARCCAALDVLIALADFARLQPGAVCLPAVNCNKDQKAHISIVEGRHPCISVTDDYIPNDTALGIDTTTLLLLTGPNMGGKSTLMRQVALLTVLAHLGSYIPAQECSLSLVDRIFTRLGASDDILSGQSTLLVEMMEAAVILKHASEHSLVLIDELGRGTSTLDGAAIAGGVCGELAARGCRAVVSTHYHSLVQDFARHPAVQLGHMACMVENECDDDSDEIQNEMLVFLYKLTRGACPKSYGFNAARLAGIPGEVVRGARAVARRLHDEARLRAAARDVCKRELQPAALRKLLANLDF